MVCIHTHRQRPASHGLSLSARRGAFTTSQPNLGCDLISNVLQRPLRALPPTTLIHTNSGNAMIQFILSYLRLVFITRLPGRITIPTSARSSMMKVVDRFKPRRRPGTPSSDGRRRGEIETEAFRDGPLKGHRLIKCSPTSGLFLLISPDRKRMVVYEEVVTYRAFHPRRNQA